MKEMVNRALCDVLLIFIKALKRSTVESSWTLNRTPLSFINSRLTTENINVTYICLEGWRRTLRTPDSLIKTDLRGSENKRGFSL